MFKPEHMLAFASHGVPLDRAILILADLADLNDDDAEDEGLSQTREAIAMRRSRRRKSVEALVAKMQGVTDCNAKPAAYTYTDRNTHTDTNTHTDNHRLRYDLTLSFWEPNEDHEAWAELIGYDRAGYLIQVDRFRNHPGRKIAPSREVCDLKFHQWLHRTWEFDERQRSKREAATAAKTARAEAKIAKTCAEATEEGPTEEGVTATLKQADQPTGPVSGGAEKWKFVTARNDVKGFEALRTKRGEPKYDAQKGEAGFWVLTEYGRQMQQAEDKAKAEAEVAKTEAEAARAAEVVRAQEEAQAGASALQPVSCREVWEKASAVLRRSLGEDVYKAWFSTFVLEKVENGKASGSLATKMIRSWIVDHYVRETISALASQDPTIQFLDLRFRGKDMNAPAPKLPPVKRPPVAAPTPEPVEPDPAPPQQDPVDTPELPFEEVDVEDYEPVAMGSLLSGGPADGEPVEDDFFVKLRERLAEPIKLSDEARAGGRPVEKPPEA